MGYNFSQKIIMGFDSLAEDTSVLDVLGASQAVETQLEPSLPGHHLGS
jgi:hypothetical protein